VQYFLKETLNDDEKKRLSTFVTNNRYGNLYQHPAWTGIADNTRITQFIYFWGEESGNIKVSALINRHRLPVLGWTKDTIRRGPVCDNSNILRDSITHLVQLLKAKGSTSLQLNPYWPYPEANAVEKTLQAQGFSELPATKGLHKHTLIIDLQKSEKEIYKGFRRFTRERIKKAEKLGMTVRPVQNESEVKSFSLLFNKLATDKQIRNLSEKYFVRLWHAFLKDKTNGIFLITRYEEEIVSGLIVLRHNTRAVATFSASENQKYLKIPKSQPNHWHAILWAKENKCNVYDLGGYLPNAPEGSSLEGVNQFKIGFSKQQEDLVGEHESIFYQKKYQFLSKIERMAQLWSIEN
jgi:lipid II:glycine glycyltransferase (peptidoglycan interpeptide bridge formation enzyme)